MYLVGLTGGIASGKTTVARLLQAKGAIVIDADEIGHWVLSRGGPGYAKAIEVFGNGILDERGDIDRTKVAAIVFSDAAKLAELESISHPQITARILELIAERQSTDCVVVVDAALLVEMSARHAREGTAVGPLALDALVVVSAEPEDQIARAIANRDLSVTDARARMQAQGPIERKLAVADYVIHNRGTIESLTKSVETLWGELTLAIRSKG
ncbi:MAG: dephospho-CoA kinase [Actinomycetota bacterium]|nr:dephospho-CoA kinase [Actinomycetota bacterium]